MNTTQEHPALVGRGWLWFGLLGGAIAWTAHLMLAYVIGEFGCLTATGKQVYLGLTVVSWLVLVLSVVTLAVAAAATWAAYSSRRQLARADHEITDVKGRSYVADAGVITSGLFTMIILVETLPILYYLRDC